MRRPDGFDRPAKPASPSSGDGADEREDARPAEAKGADAEDAATPHAATSDEPDEPAPHRGRRRHGVALTRAESHAQRTDRLLRAAERRQAALDRAAARDAARTASAASKAARKAERREMHRFTAASRRRRRTALVAVGVIVLAFAGLVGLVYSPIMAVQEIRVEGASRTDPQQIEAALGDLVGQPIATVTDAAVGDDLEQFVTLQSYVVDVVPPGTIIVRVVEREPVLVVAGDDGDRLLDPAGVDLGPVADESLPRLEDVEVGTDAFEAVVAAVVAMPDDLLERVTSVTATTTDDIQMTLADGSTVVWGSAEESDLKADVLAALVEAAAGETVTFDVSAPEHPVVR